MGGADYISVDLTGGMFAGGGAHLAYDRFGNWYFGPHLAGGVTVGGGSVQLGYMHGGRNCQKDLNDHLSGWGVSHNAGIGGVASFNWSPQNPGLSSSGVGFGFEGAGGASISTGVSANIGGPGGGQPQGGPALPGVKPTVPLPPRIVAPVAPPNPFYPRGPGFGTITNDPNNPHYHDYDPRPYVTTPLR
jgi:hypothetical protein